MQPRGRSETYQEKMHIYRCHMQYIECIYMYMYMHMGFESHLRQLIFLWKSDYLGCVVLPCFVVCMTSLSSFFLSFASLINMIV